MTAAPDPSPGVRVAIDDLRRWLGERLSPFTRKRPPLGTRNDPGGAERPPGHGEEDFALLGLAHLLAISGLHVGVFVGAIYGLLKGIGLTREKAAGAVLLLLPPMALLTGAGPRWSGRPSWRAWPFSR